MSMHESARQQEYLRKQKRSHRRIITTQLLLFVGFLALWEISSQKGLIDSFIFSSPSLIVKTFLELLQEHQLLGHISITLWETILSFLLVILISILIAVLLWMFPKAAKVLEPYLVTLNSLPKSALAPLLIVWLGANMRTIVVAGISVAVFGSIINLYTGFQEINPDGLKLIYTLGGNKKDALIKVVLPSSFPLLLGVMKVNIGLCLVGVVIGEFIGAKQGLGYLIIYSSQVFKLSWMLMSIAILCIIAILLYGILNRIEKKYLSRNQT